MELHLRVLAYLENHRKAMIESIVPAFSHEKPYQVLRSIIILKREGWVKVNKTYTWEGYTVKKPIAYRTKKQLYSQPTLSPELFN